MVDLSDLARIDEALLSPHEEVRYAAARALEGRDEPAAIGLLLRALGDRSWRVRREAAEILAASRDRETVTAALLETLGSGAEEDAHLAAAEALVLMDGAVHSAVVRSLSIGSPEARRHAADILGDLGDRRAVPTLAAALADRDRRVRLAAADALARLGTDSAAQALIVASEAVTDLGTRLACFDALALLGRAPPVHLLAEAVRHVAMRRVALRLLAHAPQAEAVPVCLDALGDASIANRHAALVALDVLRHQGLAPDEFERARVSLSEDDFALLRGALQSGDLDVRRAALSLAGWLGAAAMVADLARLARDPALQASSIEALRAMGEPGIEELQRLATEAAPGDRAAALDALAALGVPAARALCRTAIDDPHPIVAAAAARALGHYGGPEDLPALARALERGAKPLLHASRGALSAVGARVPGALRALLSGRRFGTRDEVDAAWCEVAAALGGDEERALLRRALDEGGAITRRTAAGGLGEIGTPDDAGRVAALLADERADVRLAAVRALARMCERLEPPPAAHLEAAIERALSDPEAEVRPEAALALPALGPQRAFPTLAHLAESSDAAVAEAAVAATARIGARARVADRLAVFEAALRHEEPRVVRAAVAGLGAIDEPAAYPPLRDALAHPRFEVRIAAVRALGRFGDRAATPLRERLASEEDPLVREAIRRTLAGLSGRLAEAVES